MIKIKTFALIISILIFTTISLNTHAELIYDCESLSGTSWNGELFDSNSGKSLGKIAITIDTVSDTQSYSGQFAITGTGFIDGTCSEYTEVVRSVTFSLVIGGNTLMIWSNHPSQGYLQLTNDNNLSGYLQKK